MNKITLVITAMCIMVRFIMFKKAADNDPSQWIYQ